LINRRLRYALRGREIVAMTPNELVNSYAAADTFDRATYSHRFARRTQMTYAGTREPPAPQPPQLRGSVLIFGRIVVLGGVQ
jgi:hypothetical protein